jgi:hypothetical protein
MGRWVMDFPHGLSPGHTLFLVVEDSLPQDLQAVDSLLEMGL